MEIRNRISAVGSAKCSALKCSACANLGPTAKAELERLAWIRTYRAGETIVSEMDEISFVGNVVSGVLRMQKTLHDGRQQIVGLLLPSDMFGRVFALSSNVAIEAATDVTLCCYHRASFEGLFARYPELEHRVLASISHELDAAQDWMLLLATHTVTERVASFLLMLRRRAKKATFLALSSASTIEVPISRKDMAAYLGTTVESISRSVQDMARRRAIRIIDPQHLEIVNLGLLLGMSGRDRGDFETDEEYEQARRFG